MCRATINAFPKIIRLFLLLLLNSLKEKTSLGLFGQMTIFLFVLMSGMVSFKMHTKF